MGNGDAATRPGGKPADTSLLGVGVGDYIPGICKQSLLYILDH